MNLYNLIPERETLILITTSILASCLSTELIRGGERTPPSHLYLKQPIFSYTLLPLHPSPFAIQKCKITFYIPLQNLIKNRKAGGKGW